MQVNQYHTTAVIW